MVVAALMVTMSIVPVYAQEGSAKPPTASTENTDAGLYPATSIAYFELSHPVDLVSTIFDHPLREKIEALPPYQTAIKSPQYEQFVLGRAMIETQLQMTWREAFETFAANRVSIAFDAATEGCAALVHGKDAKSMKLFHDKLLEFANAGPNRDSIKEGEYRCVTAYQIDGTRLAAYEDRMLITNKSELGKKILDQLIDGGDSLADNPRFQTALNSRGEDLSGWGFVDVQVIRDSGGGDGFFKDQIDNPVAELLIGGIQSSLQKTPYATVSFTANVSDVAVKLGMPHQAEWIPQQREYFFGPSGNGRGPAVPSLPETLFTLSTYRNFSEMWLRAGDLFGAEINDGFAKADANLTTLFAGRDFGEDILGSFEPEVSFVAARQDFRNVLPSPTIKLPAFAFVFNLKEPEILDDNREQLIAQNMLQDGNSREEAEAIIDLLLQVVGYFQDASLATGNVKRLSAQWVYRMLTTPAQLQEKMTLFWHGHFATSAAKVDDAELMQRQNDLRREHALGDLSQLLLEISRDPAMLIYLDSVSNRKSHPNENYAREIMELFALGEGNYTEQDIRELARCFTGWEIKRKKFRFNRYQHDSGTKTVLGTTGKLSGEEGVAIVAGQDTAPQFIVGKLIRFFVMDEPAPPNDLIEPLARELRKNNMQIAPTVRRILGTICSFRHMPVPETEFQLA
jgi:hypothetical protein